MQGTSHTHIGWWLLLRQGFTMYSWLAWHFLHKAFSYLAIKSIVYCFISYSIYFSRCVQPCMEATGQLAEQLLPSSLWSQDSRRVCVVFMCSFPTIRIFAQASWSTAANHNKRYFQDVLKTNLMSFKKLSPHSGKALPCVSLRGQLAVCTALKGKLAF